MAISTYKVFLMVKESDSQEYKKLIDIKDFPDLGGEPEMLETTTLSDKMQTYIPGIQSLDALKFSGNYTKAEYETVKGFEGKKLKIAVWFGGDEGENGEVTPTGSDGKYGFDGMLSVFINGGAVNEVVGMTVSVAPSTPIVPIK